MRILLSIVLTVLVLSSCQKKNHRVSSNEFVFAAWTGTNIADGEAEWQETLSKLSKAGITDLYVQAGRPKLEEIASYADSFDMDIHAWIWTLNRPGDSTAAQHPDWYSVNRNGDNSYDYRAYVNYYQWLSPFSEGARNHIKSNIDSIAQTKGIESVHLDYVRYVDVILGADLQPKYDIVQDQQFPEYDYGYHPNAREGFKELFGVDPVEMDHPELSTEWLQYRLNAVTSLVNELADIAHSHDKKITAAVFPFPEMSRQMVRQDWASWNLDIALPMLYQNFYRQNLEWIKFATEQGVREAHGRFDIISGLFVPSLTPGGLEIAIRRAKAGGAVGVSLFNAAALNPEHLRVIETLNNEWNTFADGEGEGAQAN
ncbi:MAG: hypothetical protein FH748_14180 [Balneolaceae bacterium]|nr:hypothetical protein [Balneolaceae bacterium]